MSNFDELFNSVENTEMVKNLLSDDTFSRLRSGVVEALARDSKIKLVTEFDTNNPLKTGEYFYDEESNTLYVGAGQVMGIITVFDSIAHKTSFLYLPAPRVKTYHNIIIDGISHDSSILYLPTPRIKASNNVSFTTTHDSVVVKRKKVPLLVSGTVSVNLIHESEVI